MKKGLSGVLVILPLLAGCTAMQQQAAIDRHAVKPTDFVAQAASARAGEVAGAELALKRGQSPAVRGYAARIIADAKTDDPVLDALAAQYKVSMPKALGPMAQGDIETLARLPAQDFDQAYADQASKGELDNLTFHTLAGRFSSAPNVRRYASAEQPALRRHFEEADALFNEVRRDSYAFFYSNN